jgi:hypothetical protein
VARARATAVEQILPVVMIDDEVRFLKVFHKTFGDNIRHDFSGQRDGPATRMLNADASANATSFGSDMAGASRRLENKVRTRIGSLRSMVERA